MTNLHNLQSEKISLFYGSGIDQVTYMAEEPISRYKWKIMERQEWELNQE